MAKLKSATINVGGLNNDKKREGIFQTLVNDAYDIIALQETHCSLEQAEKWKSEWPGQSNWTTGRTDQAGVAFLFNNNLNVQILDDDPDDRGRILRLTVKIDDFEMQLVNVYAKCPINEERSNFFFTQVDNHLASDLPTIMFGDFNMVENIQMDRKGGNPRVTHTYGLKALNELKKAHGLIDIWRRLNPKKKQFTWHCRYDNIESRLDRIYYPQVMAGMVSKSYIKHFVWSDHDACIVESTLPASKKGEGGTGNSTSNTYSMRTIDKK